jgi:hypothetical protein
MTKSKGLDKRGIKETIKKILLSINALDELTKPNFFMKTKVKIGRKTMGVGLMRRAAVKNSPLKRYLCEYSRKYVAANTKNMGIASICPQNALL